MSNLNFSQDEIIEGIFEDLQEFQDNEGLNFLQSISKLIVEYEQLIRFSEENKKNIFLTLKILCDIENRIHPYVENSFEQISYEEEEWDLISSKIQLPPPSVV